MQASDIRTDGAGRARFTLITPSGAAPVTLQVRGEHYVSNALATATVTHALGMGTATTAATLSRAQPLSSGRMQVLERGDGVTIINDAFNANPESTRAGLRTLATTAAGRRAIAVRERGTW